MSKLNLSKEVIIGLFINFLIANSGLLMFMIVFSAFFDDWKTSLSTSNWFIYLFIILIIYILKFSLLPLYSFYTSKYSENKQFVDFLSEVKIDKKLQNNVLIRSIVIDFIFILLNIVPTSVNYHYNFIGFISNLLTWLVVYLITGAGLFGSYVALFAWWKRKSIAINCKKP